MLNGWKNKKRFVIILPIHCKSRKMALNDVKSTKFLFWSSSAGEFWSQPNKNIYFLVWNYILYNVLICDVLLGEFLGKPGAKTLNHEACKQCNRKRQLMFSRVHDLYGYTKKINVLHTAWVTLLITYQPPSLLSECICHTVDI